ncbi:MAG: saccharopine dehydrogenase, partial [Myxococcota bacterium]
FDALLDFDVFVNCVLLGAEIPPFVTEAQIASHPSRKLSVVSDVSCDPTSPWNPIPLYDAITTVEKPVTAGRGGIDVVAIDHLPSLLPKESSEDYGEQLLPHLLSFDSDADNVWQRAEHLFREKCSGL